MSKIFGFFMGIILVSSYFFSFISAMLVMPFIWIPVGIGYALLGLFWLYLYKYKNRGVVAMGIFTVGTFVAFGQYLEFYLPAASIVVNLFGSVLSLGMMLIWYYFKEGQRRLEVRVKKEKFETEQIKEENIFDKIRHLKKILTLQKEVKKDTDYSSWMAFETAYVQYFEEIERQNQKNAVDFNLMREVVMMRNEYDQSQND